MIPAVGSANFPGQKVYPIAGVRMDQRKSTGSVLLVLSMGTFILDRLTGTVSDALGRMVCNGRYLKPVRGMVGDMSCGFNADMYLSVFLLVLFVAGGLLVIASGKKEIRQIGSGD